MGRVNLINNISCINLRSVETEAPSFGLKFAIDIKKHMGKLINTNYKNHDSDFHKGFIQSIIAASANRHSDELTLTNSSITALKSLSSNRNLVIWHSDKGRGVVIMDSTVYNQKLRVILGNNNTYEQISLKSVSININDFN